MVFELSRLTCHPILTHRMFRSMLVRFIRSMQVAHPVLILQLYIWITQPLVSGVREHLGLKAAINSFHTQNKPNCFCSVCSIKVAL